MRARACWPRTAPVVSDLQNLPARHSSPPAPGVAGKLPSVRPPASCPLQLLQARHCYQSFQDQLTSEPCVGRIVDPGASFHIALGISCGCAALRQRLSRPKAEGIGSRARTVRDHQDPVSLVRRCPGWPSGLPLPSRRTCSQCPAPAVRPQSALV